MVWKHSKEILLLTVLLVITMAINLTFIMILEVSDTGSFRDRAIRVITGHNQLDVLNAKILNTDFTEPFSIDVTPRGEDESAGDFVPVEPVLPDTEEKPGVTASSNQKVVYYRDGTPLVIDYGKKIIKVNGREIPIIVDGDASIEIVNPETKGADFWENPQYSDRFEVFVDPVFYASKQAAIDDLFNEFAERYLLLEQMTGWSSEAFYGEKLEIYVMENPDTCWEGIAIPTQAQITLRSNFDDINTCKKWYFTSFNGTIGQYGSPGELGDQWYYMSGLLHESLHSINPAPFLGRNWLTEGFSQYYQYNVLANYNGNGFTDINQETADTHIYFGTGSWNWDGYAHINNGYIGNDYHDTCTNGGCIPPNAEIQESKGYDITAWMFSMMRDQHGLDWDEFYSALDADLDVLDAASVSGNYYTDSYVIELFGRASNLTYPQTQAIFQYDGPSGPGWGVRNWENVAPNLQPIPDQHASEMSTFYFFPKATDPNGDTITYTIDNPSFVWTGSAFRIVLGPSSSGEFDFTVTTSDGELEDRETVHFSIYNRCTSFNKRYMCWVGCNCYAPHLQGPALK